MNKLGQPLVTFILFAYNQERFIKEAVEAALGQSYGNLEIIISDDCSTDSTFEIINSITSGYSGPHTLRVYKNSDNLGVAKHFSRAVAAARGELIVVAAGDDISCSTRVSKTVELFIDNPEATIVSFSAQLIDKHGKGFQNNHEGRPTRITKVALDDFLRFRSPPISGASRGFRKKAFDFFGELDVACPTEDSPFLLRGLIMGHALLSSDCEIQYRRHDSNLSKPSSLHRMNFKEIERQYIKDSQLAKNCGLISEDIFAKIKNFAERDHRRRRLHKDFYIANNKIIFFLGNIFLSSEVRFGQKVLMLLEAIVSRRKEK